MPSKYVYSRENLFLLGTIVLAFAAFCVETDIYAPSFPDMVRYFGTTESYIQYILTANFVGLSVSTLICGPLSDSYGRKLLLSIGLMIFALSSIACVGASTVDQLIFWRLVQGVGGGAITGIGTAMVFDVFPKETSAQLIAVLNSFVTGLMAVAPLAGSWINILFGWQMNFIVIAVMASLALFSAMFLAKETLPAIKRQPFSAVGALKQYGNLLTNLTFMSNTLLWTIMFGFLMVFTANLSLIYIDHLNVSERAFGFYQATIMGMFFIGSLGASKCIARYGANKTKNIGNVCFILGLLGLIILGFLGFSFPVLLTFSMCLCSLGVALACVIYYVDSMADFPHAIGALSALSQGFRLVVSAGMVGFSAKIFTGSIKPISFMACLCVILVIILYRVTLREKAKKATLEEKEPPLAVSL